jgi:hypothetical protein
MGQAMDRLLRGVRPPLIVATFDETLADALTTVRLVPRWDLEPDEWSAVETALEQMSDAAVNRDHKALFRGLEALESHGPSRLAAIARSSGPERREAPPQILDLVNTLIHPASGWEREAQPEPSSRGSGSRG